MVLTHREIVIEWFKMLDNRDHSAVIKDLITPEFRLTILPKSTGGFGVPSRTWVQVQEFLKELDKVIEVYGLSENTWIDAGDVLVGHYYSDGKLRSGSPYKNEYIGIFKFKDGKLDSFEEMMDSKYVEQVISGTA
ncbi:hypothetical protein BDQ17DRAFT_1377117 [Cyathus striatus]|nr:hypothetical protein BDQ17DRAFT_1377117 [Cyathus striatus]